MTKDNHLWSKKKVNSSVNPQGEEENEKKQQPKSQLEQRAKKKNTKI
ncbi:small, acid-soluble spore protein L [Virgibacillus sp. W0181]